MADVMDNGMHYASKGVGNAGLTLGIIGSALGLFNGNGGGLNILGNGGDKKDDKIDYLSNELMREKAERYTDQQICALKSDMYNKFDAVNSALCSQSTWNATNTATINCITSQINNLNSLLTYGVASDKVITTNTTT